MMLQVSTGKRKPSLILSTERVIFVRLVTARGWEIYNVAAVVEIQIVIAS